MAEGIRVRLGNMIAGERKVVLTNIPDLFHKIPGATDILDEVYDASLNRYQLYNRMVKRDAELNAAVNKIAMLVERAYQGIILHPGEEYTDKEKEFLKEAQLLAKKMKFKKRFHMIARRLQIDGDVLLKRQVITINNGNNEAGEANSDTHYTRYDFLPMSKMTAFGAGPYGPTSPPLNDEISGPPAVYYYDEDGSSAYSSIIGDGQGYKSYRSNEIVHIALANLAEEVYDIADRWTWGIWSLSPLESLRPTIYWRMASMVNDMIWRRLYLPREHHEIDLTDILDPNQYEGDNPEERATAANAAAVAAIAAYIKKLRTQMPDQGYVTPKVGETSAVTIKIIEPKTATYSDPNEIIAQLSKSINNAYFVKSTDSVSSSYAAEYIISSDTQIAAEHVAEIIKEYMLEELQNHFMDNEHKDKLDIRLQLIQPKDVQDLVRVSAVLRSSAVMTIDEIRVRYLGLDPLTVEQRTLLLAEMAMMRAGGASQTMDQLTADFLRRKPEDADRAEPDEGRTGNKDT